MQKALYVHYKNKYPHAQVHISDSGIVVSQAGIDLVKMEKDASGSLKCVSKAFGCRDEHDLSPIVKEARIRCLTDMNSIELHPKMAEKQAKIAADMDAYYDSRDGILCARPMHSHADFLASREAAKV